MDYLIYLAAIALLILAPAVVALAVHVGKRVCWPHEWRGDQVHRVEIGDPNIRAIRYRQRITCKHCGIVKTRRAGHL